MGNNSVGNPLISPQQLWGKKSAAPPQQPAQQPIQQPVQQPAQQLPTLPGRLPGVSPGTVVPTYVAPTDTLPSLPVQGTSTPQVPFTENPAPANPMGELTQVFKSGDDSLLGKYGVKLAKNEAGQITGVFINDQPADQNMLKQHLLPHASFLHNEIMQLKSSVDTSYSGLQGQIQQNYPTMKPQEQQAIKLQLNAMHVVYESFVNRLTQIDGLIR